MNTTTASASASETETAIMAWAEGDYALETASRITLTTTLRDQFIRSDGRPTRWLDEARRGPLEFAQPRWADLLEAEDTYLSSSARFLAQLCQNIAHGSSLSGPLDLSRGLWQLDRSNSVAVLAALTEGMTRQA